MELSGELHMTSFLSVIFGLLLMGVAVAGLLFVSSRKFYRRNSSGIEKFASFSQSVTANALEKIILFVSALLFLCGFLVIRSIFF